MVCTHLELRFSHGRYDSIQRDRARSPSRTSRVSSYLHCCARYNADTLLQAIQGRIKDLLHELEHWSRSYLGGTKFSNDAAFEQAEREHTLLQIHYWSTKILITRPCLCRTERRIKNQSDASANFNSEMARVCVASARALTGLFPDKPDPKFVYMKAPWWSVVHISKWKQIVIVDFFV